MVFVKIGLSKLALIFQWSWCQGGSVLVPKNLPKSIPNRSKNHQKIDVEIEGVLTSIFRRFWSILEAKLGRKSDQNRSKIELQLQHCYESVLGASWARLGLQNPPRETCLGKWTGSALFASSFPLSVCFLVLPSFLVSVCLSVSICLSRVVAAPSLRSHRSLRSLVRCTRPRNMKHRGDM